MTYIDECGDSWSLIPSNQIFVNDCPLELTLSSDDDTICLENVLIFTLVLVEEIQQVSI